MDGGCEDKDEGGSFVPQLDDSLFDTLDRTSLPVTKTCASAGFRASRAPVELATCRF
jgi:hypothetical protein